MKINSKLESHLNTIPLQENKKKESTVTSHSHKILSTATDAESLSGKIISAQANPVISKEANLSRVLIANPNKESPQPLQVIISPTPISNSNHFECATSTETSIYGKMWNHLKTETRSIGNYHYFKLDSKYNTTWLTKEIARIDDSLESIQNEIFSLGSNLTFEKMKETIAKTTEVEKKKKELNSLKNNYENQLSQINAETNLKNDNLYPAIEYVTEKHLSLIDSILRSNLENRYRENIETEKEREELIAYFLNMLGYELKYEGDEIILKIPDEQALKKGLDEIRKINPKFPVLTINTLPGLASDLDFVKEACFNNDIILSLDELIHDSLAHSIQIIQLVICTLYPLEGEIGDYEHFKSEGIKIIRADYETIVEARKSTDKADIEKLEFTLGLLVDTIKNQCRPENMQGYLNCKETLFEKWISFVWGNNPDFSVLLNRRFPGNINIEDNIEHDHLQDLWKTLRARG